ncbi:MAG: ATP synthase F0 subunit B [Clostridiales bacterium]|nr:ATP synthase F0 subunit B [Clostridiales bacterium]
MRLLLAAATPEGRIFGLDAQTLISAGIILFNVCLLAVVLSLILYKPVRKFLKKRADGIREQLETSKNDMARANELKALYEEKLTETDAERIRILEQAQTHAAERRRKLMETAENEIAAMKAQAAADIQAERVRADEEMRVQMIEVASLMAEKFVALSLDAQTHNRIFEESMAELEHAL